MSNDPTLVETATKAYAQSHDNKVGIKTVNERIGRVENDHSAFREHLKKQNGDITEIKVRMTSTATNVQWLMWFNGIVVAGMVSILFKLFIQ